MQISAEPGGEKPYRLLADAMEETGKVALAEMLSHNKKDLVLIRPAKRGLVLQTMFYANEARTFAQSQKRKTNGRPVESLSFLKAGRETIVA